MARTGRAFLAKSLIRVPYRSSVRTISNAGGNWSSAAAWVEKLVPTAADDVVATATSGNLSHDSATQNCRSIDFTNYTGTFTFVSGQGALLVGDVGGGDVKLVAGMTISYLATGGGFTFQSTSGAIQKFTSAGQSIGACNINVGSTTTIQLQDTVVSTVTTAIQSFTVTAGLFDTNNKNMTVLGFLMPAGTKTVTLGSSTINISATANNTSLTSNGVTFTANTAIFNFTGSGPSINPGTFNWNGATFQFSGGGTCAMNGGATTTVGSVVINSATATTLKFPTGAWSFSNLTANGTAGAHHAIISSTAGTACVINSFLGTASVSYCDFTDVSIVGLSCPIDATVGCIDNGNNRGIKFATPYIAQSTSSVQATSTTAAPVFLDNTKTGNTIVVATYNALRVVSGITDSQGNTYQLIDSTTGPNPNTELWYAFNIVGGTTPTVTVTFSAAAALCEAAVYEIGGVSASNPLDVHVTASGSSTAAASGNTAATSVVNELVVCYLGTVSATLATAGSGYTNLVVRSNLGLEAKAVAATGVQSGAFTVGNAAWNCGVATFKAAGVPRITNVNQTVATAGTR